MKELEKALKYMRENQITMHDWMGHVMNDNEIRMLFKVAAQQNGQADKCPAVVDYIQTAINELGKRDATSATFAKILYKGMQDRIAQLEAAK